MSDPMTDDLARDVAYGGAGPAGDGVIRSTCADFAVIETLSYEFTGAGEHTCLRVRKTGNNTGWVASRLAAFAGIRDSDVGYAGRKDRHAVCEQWFSLYLPANETTPWSTFAEPGIEILGTTRHARKIRLGDVQENRFDLVIRDVAGDAGAIGASLARIASAGFPNYFGDQRFGRGGGNLERAHDLLVNGIRVAEGSRQMVVAAARSHLFNRYLSDVIVTRGFDAIGIEETGPLYGRSRDPQAGEDRLGEVHRQWVAGLRRLRLSVEERRLRVVPSNLRWQFDDNRLRLAFGLPSGAYATSLLREVLRVREPEAIAA